MKNNKKIEIIKEKTVVKWIKIVLACYFLISIVIKYESQMFISPKPWIPLAQTKEYADFFYIFKFDSLVFLSLLLLFLVFIFIYKKDIKFEINDLFILTISLLTIFSVACSDYKYISLWGTYERHTSAVFFLILLMLFFISSKIEYDEKDINKVYYLFGIFIIINFIYMLIYTLGINLMEKGFFQKLILVPEEYRSSVKGFVLGTLENPNYFSGFAGFLFLFFLVKYLFEKTVVNFFGIMNILIIGILLFSYSSSGYFSIFLTFPFLFYYLYVSGILNEWKVLLRKIIFIFLPVIFLMIFVANKNIRILNEIESFIVFLNIYISYYLIYFIVIILFLFMANKSNIIDFIYKYKYFVFLIFSISVIILFIVFPTSPHFKQHPPDKLYEYSEVKEMFEEKDFDSGLFTGRKNIWWYTFDLIKEKPLIGYGMSTLLLEFPQTSPLKILYLGDNILSKPHNHYLEILYGVGIFALILFLLLFLDIFINFIYKTKYHFDYFNLSAFLGMLAFLFQGLVNDMDVGSYPMIFITLGFFVQRLKNTFVLEDEGNVQKGTKNRKN